MKVIWSWRSQDGGFEVNIETDVPAIDVEIEELCRAMVIAMTYGSYSHPVYTLSLPDLPRSDH